MLIGQLLKGNKGGTIRKIKNGGYYAHDLFSLVKFF